MQMVGETMELALIGAVAILSIVVAWLAHVVNRDRKVPRTLVIQRPGAAPLKSSAALRQAPMPLPASIALDCGRGSAMEISVVAEGQDKKLAASQKLDDALARNVLASLPAVLPNLVLAQQVAATHLMKVVIRGDLVRAADGIGWRAFAMGNDGIATQARLMNPSGLQWLATGVLVFQLLSVVVGQKHLADIGRQLKTINRKLDEIRGLLRAERRSHIQASFRYVVDAVHAIENHEFSSAVVRQQLESSEYQLLVVFDTIQADIDQVLQRPLMTSLMGSNNEYISLSEKLKENRVLFEEMSACIEVRQACCYAASLFPGERELMTRRLSGLKDDIGVFSTEWDNAKRTMKDDVGKITSKWAPSGAQDSRDRILAQVSEFNECIDRDVARHRDLDQRISAAMSDMGTPRTLYVTVQNESVKEVHLAVEQLA